MKSKVFKFLLIIIPSLLILFVAGVAIWVRQLKISSFPEPGRGGVVASLESGVKIEQDAKGIPTIRAQSLLDAYRAMGWVHARDRLFQMDLIRRQSSGRLSEIFGEKLVEIDQLHRWMGFVEIAKKAESKMVDGIFNQFKAYADGVNAFIESGPLPFEMQIIGYQPEPWSVSDSVLAILSMFEQMDFYGQSGSERAMTLIRNKRGPEVQKFLASFTGFRDMPLMADPTENLIPIPPSEEVLSIRNEKFKIQEVLEASIQTPVVGSNGWVMSGKHTRSGKPIVAGDPHLSVNLPNIWYRHKMIIPEITLSGMSLPGVPGTIIGNNRFAVWTMTNAYADPIDLIKISTSEKIETIQETIEVKNAEPVTFTYEVSQRGPVFEEVDGNKYAFDWVARDPNVLAKAVPTAINLAKNLPDFKAAIGQWHGPLMNFIYATSEGDIGWQLVGRVPKRVGFNGQVAELRDDDHYWDGYYQPSEMPQLHNPITGMVVSGNHRKVPVKDSKLEVLPFVNNIASNSRAWRLNELLTAQSKWTAKQMFEVQMDNYSYEIEFYRKTFLNAYEDAEALSLMSEEEVKWLDEIKKHVSAWNGTVDVNQPAYPLLRRLRSKLTAHLLEPIAGIKETDDTLLKGWKFRPVFRWYYLTAPLNALMTHQPKHLLSPEFESYSHAVLKAMMASAKALTEDSFEAIRSLSWGNQNQIEVYHPFARAMPDFLAKYFRVPKKPFGGDHWTPRVGVQWRGFFHSASMRFATDLTDIENESYVTFPGGQSGHFQSPNFRDQYDNWLANRPQAFEPGKTVVEDRLSAGR